MGNMAIMRHVINVTCLADDTFSKAISIDRPTVKLTIYILHPANTIFDGD